MDMRQLQYFVTCAEQKNFSAAAELLYTSQPHVSMVIQSLERELSTQLFDRTPKGVTLTGAGMRNYEHAISILKNARLMQTAGAQQKHPMFTLYTNSSSNMAVLFARFFDRHQDYHYRYMEAGVETIIEKIALHESELGFVFIPSNKKTAFRYMLKRKKLHFVPLLKTDMVIYVGNKNPLYKRKSLKPEELSRLRFIQMTDDYFSFQELLGDALQSKDLQYMAENVIETNSNHTMVQVLQSSDLCNLCSYWLRDRYKCYDFKMIPVEGFQNKITFGYIHNQEEDFSAIANEFICHVTDIIAEER